MSNIYLVDLENVHHPGIKNAPYLNKDDEVIIFYSNNANIHNGKIPEIIKKSEAKVITKEVYLCGKNSLDFQLVAYLGTRLKRNSNDTFYIVSKDKGYCSVVLFFQDVADVYLIPEILVDVKGSRVLQGEMNPMVKRLEEKVNNIGIKGVAGNSVVSILLSSNSLLNYHNDLVKIYGANSAKEIYRETKSFWNLLA